MRVRICFEMLIQGTFLSAPVGKTPCLQCNRGSSLMGEIRSYMAWLRKEEGEKD